MAYTYQEELLPDALARYKTKLNLINLDQCPYKEPANRWINDPKQWPKISYADVYHYLIKSPRIYSAEAMENYRSLDAHVFFVSGWVQTVYHLKINSGIIVLKADVRPSWRVTEEPHHPWVALKKDGPVLAAHCDCMAGLGETCSHIGALLFKMEAAVRLGYTSSTCTDIPCKWNQCFVKNAQPSPIAQIKFYTDKAKEKLRETKRNPKPLPSPSSNIQQSKFLDNLKSVSANIVGFSAFKKHCEEFIGIGPTASTRNLPANLRNLYSENNKNLCEEKLHELCIKTFNELSISKEEISFVEETTKTQSLSTTWHQVRIGRITASVAGEVMRTKLDNPSTSLIKKICVPNDKPLRVPAIEWGREHEENAMKPYNDILNSSSDIIDKCPSGNVYVVNIPAQHSCELHTVSKAGFHISPNKPHIGASPDGIISCEKCGNGLLEIKCPYSIKEKTLKEAVGDSSFCLDEKFQLKSTHVYFTQVQTQMFVSDAKYCDFVVWTPIDCAITRVARDDTFITNMLVKFESFWRFFIVPELLTRKEENKTALAVLTDITNNDNCAKDITNNDNNAKTFCICKSSSEEGDMVGCDKCDQWFHLECLKLKRLPRTKTWYCKQCRLSVKK